VSGAPPRRTRSRAINTSSGGLCLPPALQAIFQPSLVPGETRLTYSKLLEEIAPTNQSDIIAWIHAKEVADLTFEVIRLRRAKAGRIAQVVGDLLSAALCSSLVARGGCQSRIARRVEKLMTRWRRGDPQSLRDVDQLLEEVGTNVDALLGEAFRQEMHLVQALEQLTSLAESRRRSVLKEASRWAAGLGKDLRFKSDHIIAVGLRREDENDLRS
jgi:hypothetical protein